MTSPGEREGRVWLTEAIAVRDLERVPRDINAAAERINDALRHVRSARKVGDDDVTLGISACHDAIRKAITAHMVASGLRPRGGEGAHRIVLQYARNELATVIDAADIDDADALRRDRGIAEYGDFARSKLRPVDVVNAANLAERIVNAVKAATLAMQMNKPRGPHQ